MANAESVKITVAYGVAARQTDCTTLELPPATTLMQALEASGVLQRHGLSLDNGDLVVGIWGKARPLDTPLRDNDRVELWRALKVDPKEARRQRYRKQPK